MHSLFHEEISRINLSSTYFPPPNDQLSYLEVKHIIFKQIAFVNSHFSPTILRSTGNHTEDVDRHPDERSNEAAIIQVAL